MGNGVKWTAEQEAAIYEKNENILVAAAAGSGKTAVLVERIIQKILKDKIDIDKLLVVTFTNAAASEMRERVLEAIYKKLDEEPDNKDLQRQIVLLGKSNICTIHSFCLDVIRNYFYEIDLPANFRIGSEEEIELLRLETIDDIFEELYELEDKNFAKLVEVYTNYRGDEALRDLVLKIYKYIQSSPFPKEWLHEKTEMFNCEEKFVNEINKNIEFNEEGNIIQKNERDFGNSEWGKILLEELREELYDAICNLKIVENKISIYDELEKFSQAIRKDIEKLREFYDCTKVSWDRAYEYSSIFKFDMWPRDSKVTLELKDYAKNARDTVKKKVQEAIDKIMLYPSSEAFEDIYSMYEILKNLEDVINKFDAEFKKRKKDKNLIDFNDIEHFALKILVTKDEEGKAIPTDIAKQYQEKFTEIAIDEYQDSNQVQEYILSMISKGNNIFMVGDVKQSIYKFRQACPDLFLDKYSKYTKVKEGKGLKIQLFKNFRSRCNILDFTNNVFETIMSKELGDLDYTEEEFLNLGASYPEEENSYSEKNNATTEMLLIDLKDEEKEPDIYKNNEEGKDKETQNIENQYINNLNVEQEDEIIVQIEKEEIEARLVTRKIQEIIKSKIKVFDKKVGMREVQYRDIVILLRSTSNLAQIYEKELNKNNIPVYSDANSEFLDTYEIQTIMNTLKIIDNPTDDISLVSVLRSEIGAFSDNDLIEIRLENRESSFYKSMIDASVKLSGKLQEKIKEFLSRLDSWKKKSKYMSLTELIWEIYTETGFLNYVSLMPNGNLRQANLKKLFERAKSYESSSFKGLFNFLRFMEKIRVGSGDLSPAKMIGENENVVRIMSIHKSKGLEFPIVFLSSTSKRINLMDLNDTILLHQKLGLGPEYINYMRRIQYSTAAKRAIQVINKKEAISEEMRVLYVALTRAKEKLYITGCGKDIEKELAQKEDLLNIYVSKEGRINPILLKKFITYKDWIELIFKQGNLKENIKIHIIPKKELMQDKEEKEVVIKEFPFNTEYDLNELKKILNYEYKYKIASMLPLKSTVSKIKEMQKDFVDESDLFDLETSLIDNQYMLDLPTTIASSLGSEENSNNKFIIKNKIDFENQKPKFMQEEESINSSEKGTLTHFILQKIDFNKQYTINELNDFINSFVAKRNISEVQASAINRKNIMKFLESDLSKDLQKARIIEREKTFCTKILAKDVFKDVEFSSNSEEYILVQGIIDLFYKNSKGEWILLDYKTDYVENGKENELKKKYTKQLEIYKKALEDEIKEKVAHTYIYSLYLNKVIEI